MKRILQVFAIALAIAATVQVIESFTHSHQAHAEEHGSPGV